MRSEDGATSNATEGADTNHGRRDNSSLRLQRNLTLRVAERTRTTRPGISMVW